MNKYCFIGFYISLLGGFSFHSKGVNADVPVTSSESIMKNSIIEELSKWTINSLGDGAQARLVSPTSKLSQRSRYCSRLVVQFNTKTHLSPNTYFSEVITNGSPFREYYFGDCKIVDESSYFQVYYQGALNHNIGMLDIVHLISTRGWRNADSKLSISFDDEISRHCIERADSIEFSRVEELIGEGDYLEYLISTTPCTVNNGNWIVSLHVREHISGQLVDIQSKALSTDYISCIENECYREID